MSARIHDETVENKKKNVLCRIGESLALLSPDDCSTVLQTFGIIVALNFASICSAQTWISFEDLVMCGRYTHFADTLAKTFQFGFAQMVTLIVNVVSISIGREKKFKKLIPYLCFVVSIHAAVFTITCVHFAQLIESVYRCQRGIALGKAGVEVVSEGVNVTRLVSDPQVFKEELQKHSEFNIFNAWGPFAWFIFMTPLSLLTLIPSIAISTKDNSGK